MSLWRLHIHGNTLSWLAVGWVSAFCEGTVNWHCFVLCSKQVWSDYIHLITYLYVGRCELCSQYFTVLDCLFWTSILNLFQEKEIDIRRNIISQMRRSECWLLCLSPKPPQVKHFSQILVLPLRPPRRNACHDSCSRQPQMDASNMRRSDAFRYAEEAPNQSLEADEAQNVVKALAFLVENSTIVLQRSLEWISSSSKTNQYNQMLSVHICSGTWNFNESGGCLKWNPSAGHVQSAGSRDAKGAAQRDCHSRTCCLLQLSKIF